MEDTHMSQASEKIDTRPRLALLLGDCTGIGPELCAKILYQGKVAENARLVVVGDARVFELGIRDAKIELPWVRVTRVAEINWTAPEIPVIDLGNIDPALFPQGIVSAESGRLTGETLAYAIEMARRGEVEGITF